MVDESRVTVTARCESTASSSTLFPPRDPLSGVAGAAGKDTLAKSAGEGDTGGVVETSEAAIPGDAGVPGEASGMVEPGEGIE